MVSLNQLRTAPNGQSGTSVPAQDEMDSANNLQEPERGLCTQKSRLDIGLASALISYLEDPKQSIYLDHSELLYLETGLDNVYLSC